MDEDEKTFLLISFLKMSYSGLQWKDIAHNCTTDSVIHYKLYLFSSVTVHGLDAEAWRFLGETKNLIVEIVTEACLERTNESDCNAFEN